MAYTLPHSLQTEALKYLDSDKVIEYCKNGTLPSTICSDFYFWRDLAVKDFKFPSEAFPFFGTRKSLGAHYTDCERYIKIKNDAPSKVAIRNLTILAHIYDFDKDALEMTLSANNFPDYHLYALQDESKDVLIETIGKLGKNYTTLPVSESIIFNLTTTLNWYRYVEVNSEMKLFEQEDLKINTMVRGNKNEQVTYFDILKNVRNLVPFQCEYISVIDVEFSGFTNYGVPTIAMKLEWII